jgi:AraC family transcriptional activator of tynA and feaB
MVAMGAMPAGQSWSTADVESRHALAYWTDTVCRSFLEIDIDSRDRERFNARLHQAEFGPATLHVVEASAQSIRRTPARIAQSRYAGYLLLQLSAGTLRFQQYGRDSCVLPGDCILVDCSAPYDLQCLDATRSVTLRYPREWLRNWVPHPEKLAGRPLRAGDGWGHVLSAALANLATDSGEPLALPEGVVAEQIAALLALAAGPDTQLIRPSEKILNRIRRSLADRCHEAGLTPAAVAKEHKISTRYLHHLFAQTKMTFGSELMRLRLESGRRLLLDTRYSALSVSEVAARCGFLEPSHFARRFRRAYGAAPVEFRRARGGGVGLDGTVGAIQLDGMP